MFTNIFFLVLTQSSLKMGSVCFCRRRSFNLPILQFWDCAVRSSYVTVLSHWDNRGHSGQLNKKHQAVEPPSYVHRRIYVSIERIAAIKQRENTGKQNATGVALNVSAFNINVLCEIVSRSGFASACEYCIYSSSKVSKRWTPNSNTVPNSFGIGNKMLLGTSD